MALAEVGCTGGSVCRAAGRLWLQWIEHKQLDHDSGAGQRSDASDDYTANHQLDNG
jgi:hypothetical protein